MTNSHFVVLIDGMRWRVVYMRGKRFMVIRQVDADEHSRHALLMWWREFPDATISFVTDEVAEHYHVETIPHVQGAAGRQLLSRKLAAWPYAQGLFTACQLDRTQALRLEDRVLFIALTSPALSGWLPTLTQNAIRLKLICTQALLLTCWLPVMVPMSKHIVCLQYSCSGLRMSYLKDQRLFLSQVITSQSLAVISSDSKCISVAEHIGQIYLYCKQQLWLNSEESLQVLWLGKLPNDLQGLPHHLPFKAAWQVLSEHRMADAFGQPPAAFLSATDMAVLHAINARYPVPNLAPNEALFVQSAALAKRRLHVAGLVATSLILLSLALVWHGIQARQGLLERDRYVLAQMPTPDLDSRALTQLRGLTQTIEEIQSSVRMPHQALHLAEQVLQPLVAWQLVELTWQLSADPTAEVEEAAHWQETLLVGVQATHPNKQAEDEWLQMLSHFKRLPALARVEVVTPGAAHIERKGGTLPVLIDDRPMTLKLHFAPPVTEDKS